MKYDNVRAAGASHCTALSASLSSSREHKSSSSQAARVNLCCLNYLVGTSDTDLIAEMMVSGVLETGSGSS